MVSTRLRREYVVAMIVVFFGALIGTGTAHAETPAEAQNIARVQQGFDAWRAGTGSVFDLLTDDATWEVLGNTPVSGVYPNKAELQQKVLDPFNARLSDGLKPTVRHLYADGDTVIAFFDASANARDGVPYHNVYTWYLHMRGGRIIAVEALLDSVAFNDLWHRVPA